MRLPSKTDIGNFALAALIGGNIATIGHESRKEVSSICESIQAASANAVESTSVGERIVNPITCLGTRIAYPFVCHENAPLNPSPWSTGEAWGGAAIGDGIMLAIYAVMSRRKKKKKETGRKPPSKL